MEKSKFTEIGERDEREKFNNSVNSGDYRSAAHSARTPLGLIILLVTGPTNSTKAWVPKAPSY